ncbi:MAG: molybdenum cofactor guanylyltransferase [Candidatus Bathyarchaeota archaeon]|nr:molybdenum cofactor guanylyltransferase [Candidatus Bathyarchaeota archaeon]
MDRSAIILASGISGGFSGDKGLLELAGKPLLRHVVDAVQGLAGEIFVVTSSKDCANSYAKIVPPNVQFIIDMQESKGPLTSALTGFEAVGGDYSLLLPFDSPFVSREVVSLLFELCVGKAAVIPRWTNMQIEPLHAVYHTKQAIKAAEVALSEGATDVEAMVEKLRGVRYISMMVIEQLDPDLRTFFSINTPLYLKKARTTKPTETRRSPASRD